MAAGGTHFNGDFTKKLLLVIFGLVATGAWGYGATRASSQELKETKDVVMVQHTYDQEKDALRFQRNEEMISENKVAARDIERRLTSIQVTQGQILTILKNRLPEKE